MASWYNGGCIERQRNHWRHRISCCKREVTKPKNKSHRCHLLNKSEKNNVTTNISSLNLDSITLSCLLTVSKQLECVSDSLKQFYDSLAPSWAPSELLFLPVAETTSLPTESPNVRRLWLLESLRATSWCLHTFLVVYLTLDLASSCVFFNNTQCLWWSTGCPMQGQQCCRHRLTGYLVFENVLIVYGIILESTDVTWCSVFIQGKLTVGYSPPYIYYELMIDQITKFSTTRILYYRVTVDVIIALCIWEKLSKNYSNKTEASIKYQTSYIKNLLYTLICSNWLWVSISSHIITTIIITVCS